MSCKNKLVYETNIIVGNFISQFQTRCQHCQWRQLLFLKHPIRRKSCLLVSYGLNGEVSGEGENADEQCCSDVPSIGGASSSRRDAHRSRSIPSTCGRLLCKRLILRRSWWKTSRSSASKQCVRLNCAYLLHNFVNLTFWWNAIALHDAMLCARFPSAKKVCITHTNKVKIDRGLVASKIIIWLFMAWQELRCMR